MEGLCSDVVVLLIPETGDGGPEPMDEDEDEDDDGEGTTGISKKDPSVRRSELLLKSGLAKVKPISEMHYVLLIWSISITILDAQACLNLQAYVPACKYLLMIIQFLEFL